MSMLVKKQDVKFARFFEIEDILNNYMESHECNETVCEIGSDYVIQVNDPFVYVKELGLIMAEMTFLSKVCEGGYTADFAGTALFKLVNEHFEMIYFEQDSMFLTAANHTRCSLDKLCASECIIFKGANFVHANHVESTSMVSREYDFDISA